MFGPPDVTVDASVTSIILSAAVEVQPAGTFVVNVNFTVPEKLASGVKLTLAGFDVCARLLKVPLPNVIVHAPVVAPPPTLAPVNANEAGDAV